jgi:hypothetical protein
VASARDASAQVARRDREFARENVMRERREHRFDATLECLEREEPHAHELPDRVFVRRRRCIRRRGRGRRIDRDLRRRPIPRTRIVAS